MNTTHYTTNEQLAHNEGLTIHTMPSMASMIALFEDLGSEADAYEFEDDDGMLAEDMQAYEALLATQIEDL